MEVKEEKEENAKQNAKQNEENLNVENQKKEEQKDVDNLSQTNLIERILSEFIGRKIIDKEIKDLGITISDRSLRDIIKNDKTFFKSNKFSRTEYEKFLLKSNLTAPLFERNVAEQEKKRQLLSFLASGITVPHFLVKSEFNKENQSKTIKYINLDKIYKNSISGYPYSLKLAHNNCKISGKDLAKLASIHGLSNEIGSREVLG